MLKDNEGNLAYSKVIVTSVFGALLVAFLAVGLLIAFSEPPPPGSELPGVWERFEGWMKWGSATFLGSGTLFHIGHRATHKATGVKSEHG